MFWKRGGDPGQRAKLGLAVGVLVLAIVVISYQMLGSRPPLERMNPDEVAAAKEAAREADRQVLAGLNAPALKDELERRTIAVDEVKKMNDPARLQEAEEALARINEAMRGTKK